MFHQSIEGVTHATHTCGLAHRLATILALSYLSFVSVRVQLICAFRRARPVLDSDLLYLSKVPCVRA